MAPVFELLIKDGDLIGTHRRSIWILDDLTPIRSAARNGTPTAPTLIAPRHALRVMPGVDWSAAIPGRVNYYGGMGGGFDVHRTPEGETRRLLLDSGENPAFGAVLTYFLPGVPCRANRLSIGKSAKGSSFAIV